MARSQSDNLEIVPPRRATIKSLAETLDSAFAFNANSDMQAGTSTEAIGTNGRKEQAGARRQDKSSASTSNQHQPCERCVRTKRTCKGAVGARCEHCKHLKQKCSNSTGPARGKHAAAQKAANGLAVASAPPKLQHPAPPDESVSTLGQKRKIPMRLSASNNGDLDDVEEDEEDDGHEPPAKLNKKRRTAMSGAIAAAKVLRYVGELEATIKRLEETHAREMEKIQTIISALTKDMKDLSDD